VIASANHGHDETAVDGQPANHQDMNTGLTSLSKHSMVNPRARHDLRLRSCSITAVASYLPERVLTNADIGKRLGETGEWILPRTGIRERRIASGNEFTSDLAAQAALRALDRASLDAKNLDLILVATNTSDMFFPATACLVQAKIGARRCPALDLKAGGAGFLSALEIGSQFIGCQTFETVLVIGAEKLSTILDWDDRDTCVLFGDGAGAVILQHRPHAAGLLVSSLGSDGSKCKLLSIAAGGSRVPTTQESVAGGLHFLRMHGGGTFKHAVIAMCEAVHDALQQSGVALSQIKCIIPHQSNRRIIDAFVRRVGAAPDQLFVNLERVGNTSAASIPIALAEAAETGRVRRGDLILLVAFGGGLTWGATVVEW
jgi:3-oxoacyl-[acyl-carrier-protein] synthase-3